MVALTCPDVMVSMGSVTLPHSGGVQPRRDLTRDVNQCEGREGRAGTLTSLCDECKEIITFFLILPGNKDNMSEKN